MPAGWNDLTGLNLGYALDLYDRYRRDAASVDPATRTMFDAWPPPPQGPAIPAVSDTAKTVAIVTLAESIRRYGHLGAEIDPLGREPQGDPALAPETHGLSLDDLRGSPSSLVGGPLAATASNAYEAIEALRRVYMSHTGYDYAHIFVPEERDWLCDAAERGRFRSPTDPIDPQALLVRLTEVEVFEQFLHRSFPGKTRFSLEGLDMLVPVLDEVIGEAAEADMHHILVGMAHRGRLNVLAHVLNKPYAQILAEFKDPAAGRSFREDMAWSGDVKYHMGARRAVKDGSPVDLVVSMPPNPSHLEAIDPVVEGMARAAGTSVAAPGPARFDPALTLPILIHGDASFPGQGVVAETLNFLRLPGYHTGGTVHIIVNNQLGFTTDSRDAYSTLYASGLARGFKVPIVHVNADDPEACIEAARLAFAYRGRFRKDFLIDLVGYRRYGHNEGDEPSFTQPLMYARIADHPTVRRLWANTLVARRAVEPDWPEALVRHQMEKLQDVLASLQAERDLVEPFPILAPPGTAQHVKTGVPLERLAALNSALLALPPDFTVHRKLEKTRERRRRVLDHPEDRTIDWATAEELALASILEEGIPIRFTGEDVERGTFGHRHAVLHDPRTGGRHTPLASFGLGKAGFEICNSPLTENAVLGFEYGYNVQAPERLVLWEAQYGDFINGAQVVLDEFVMSARAKWGQTPSLVLLLPHGQEGQGPDHASARPERFLELAVDINLRMANCTTAAQYFHLLRRQALLLRSDPLPLVVLTPKSLLRHPLVASSPRELAEGRWQPVIDDVERVGREADVRRLVLCSGKIYVDLVTSDRRPESPAVALCRVEQLNPFPERELDAVLDRYQGLEDIAWVQEEPENMGAWPSLRWRLAELVGGRWQIRYVGRPASSSPAEGSTARHAITQAQIVEAALPASDVKRSSPAPALEPARRP
jgi:2-oxoglutarate dehydrogenase E1 component